MIRVVVDTGIVVSAAFRDRTPGEIILFIAAQDDFDWIASPAILDEYNEVLARKKFGLPDSVLQKWREVFNEFTIVIDPDIEIEFPRDQKDAKFLECALASDADYLISGDKDFQEAHKLINTTVISVSQFKGLIMNEWSQ